MKGLFSRLGGAPAKQQAEKTQSQDDELQKTLARAGEVVNKLKGATEENFPLLNEATRLGNCAWHPREVLTPFLADDRLQRRDQFA